MTGFRRRSISPPPMRLLSSLLLICLVSFAAVSTAQVSTQGVQTQDERTLPQNPVLPGSQIKQEGPVITAKQRRSLIKFNFERMKHDADELSTLAKSLQDDLDKSNENVLSLKVVDKAEKIEKLAKKIKATARGY